jgi:hypothetical protein
MNIQTKVTILFITLTSAVILLLSGFIFLFTYHYAFEDFYQRLETRARIAQSIHFNKDRDSTGVMQQLRQQYLEKLPSEEEYYLKLTSEMEIVPPFPGQLTRELIEQILADGEAKYRQGNRFFAGNLYPTSSPTTIVVVSAADPYGLKELNRLRNALIICFLVSILVVYLMGKVFSYQTFKPIRELIAKVQHILQESEKLPICWLGC